MPQRALAALFHRLEFGLDACFGRRWNPLYQLGALGFFYYWVVAVSGIYLYIFFDTGTTAAYESVERLTHDQWYLGGVMRSLHRYASDGMVLMMGVHILREYALGHLKGPRWFTWTTGIPIAGLIVVAGISGYWLVWDRLAQYVAIESMEWFDWLGIFGEPIARNFAAPNTLDDRFFTLLVFIHIVVPLLLLLVLWIHLQRVTRPAINPNRSLALGTFAMLVVLSLIRLVLSGGLPLDGHSLRWRGLGSGAHGHGGAGGSSVAAATLEGAPGGGPFGKLQRLRAMRRRLSLQRDLDAAAQRRPALRARGGGRSVAVRRVRPVRRRLPDRHTVSPQERSAAGHRAARSDPVRVARRVGSGRGRFDRGAACHRL
jgi:hypothetical protein